MDDLFASSSESEAEIAEIAKERQTSPSLASSLTRRTLPTLETIDTQTLHLKVPSFLQFEPAQSTTDSTSTISWKYIQDKKNNSIIGRQSNSRLVIWSDDSISLLIGDNLMQTKMNKVDDSFVFYGLDDLFKSVFSVEQQIIVKPNHTRSLVELKKSKIKSFTPVLHPEVEISGIEKLEYEKERARKRLEAKQRNVGLKFGNDLNMEMLEEDSDPYEMDFIDDDNIDEKVEESKRKRAPSEDEEEESEEEDEPQVVSKKRQIIESDSD